MKIKRTMILLWVLFTWYTVSLISHVEVQVVFFAWQDLYGCATSNYVRCSTPFPLINTMTGLQIIMFHDHDHACDCIQQLYWYWYYYLRWWWWWWCWHHVDVMSCRWCRVEKGSMKNSSFSSLISSCSLLFSSYRIAYINKQPKQIYCTQARY